MHERLCSGPHKSGDLCTVPLLFLIWERPAFTVLNRTFLLCVYCTQPRMARVYEESVVISRLVWRKATNVGAALGWCRVMDIQLFFRCEKMCSRAFFILCSECVFCVICLFGRIYYLHTVVYASGTYDRYISLILGRVRCRANQRGGTVHSYSAP